MIGFSIVIVDEWIVKNQASYLAPGTLAYLQYGRTLMKVPIGIFGMAAYSVSKRLRELGIRVALGAQRRQIIQAALARPLRLLTFGSAAGLILGILASRVLAHIVYLATPRDPVVLAGVVLAMAVLGLAATWIPARRAVSVDPMILLRDQ